MKKLLIILLAVGFLTACKGKENAKEDKTENKATDDYQKKSNDEDKKESDYKETGNEKTKLSGDELDEDGNSKADVESITGQDDSEDLGWPQRERDSFVTSCVREAVKGGMDRVKATRYCDCMLVKIEGMYPDIKVAEKLTNKDVNDITERFAKGCLR